jgi:hypothetical protein
MNSSFYRRPIFDSFYFRCNTTGLVVILSLGAYFLAHYWSNLFFLTRLYVAVVLVGLLGLWIRAIVDHRAMSKRLDEDQARVSSDHLMKLAAIWPTYGLSVLYLIAGTLLFSLAFTVKYYDSLLTKACGGLLK